MAIYVTDEYLPLLCFQNLIKNFKFDLWSGGLPKFWDCTPESAISQDAGYIGHALKMYDASASPTANQTIDSEFVDFLKGRTLYFTVYVKTPSATGEGIGDISIITTTTTGTTTTTTSYDASDSWTRVAVSQSIPTNATEIKVQLKVNTGYTALFDLAVCSLNPYDNYFVQFVQETSTILDKIDNSTIQLNDSGQAYVVAEALDDDTHGTIVASPDNTFRAEKLYMTDEDTGKEYVLKLKSGNLYLEEQ